MRVPLETRYADYDSKGHANNAVYLTYFEMARHRVWVDCMHGDADFPFIVAEATVRYVSEAMIGQPLDIEIVTSEVRTKAWVWSYVIRARDGDRVVAEGRTVQVMYDYAARRTMPIPDAMRALLATI
ncbi:MAG TPA: thioesterase family protein [Gemmatimonadaceae bacterium]|nr:thioesterase family protein [Gemmatimonadaceae bacterium]